MTEIKDKLKSLLMKLKEESEKVDVKLNIQNQLGLKINIQKMASGSITLWQIDGETIEIVRDFISLGSKIRW